MLRELNAFTQFVNDNSVAIVAFAIVIVCGVCAAILIASRNDKIRSKAEIDYYKRVVKAADAEIERLRRCVHEEKVKNFTQYMDHKRAMAVMKAENDWLEYKVKQLTKGETETDERR